MGEIELVQTRQPRPGTDNGCATKVRQGALVAVTLLLILNSIAGTASQRSEENPLISGVRLVLQRENAAIGRVAVLEVRAFSPDGPYVLIGWGVRSDRRFEGSFRDELFGIFLVNRELTRIERTLEILPTPRWLDYSLWIDDISASDVTVVGKGSTYGDAPIRRVYRLQR